MTALSYRTNNKNGMSLWSDMKTSAGTRIMNAAIKEVFNLPDTVKVEYAIYSPYPAFYLTERRTGKNLYVFQFMIPTSDNNPNPSVSLKGLFSDLAVTLKLDWTANKWKIINAELNQVQWKIKELLTEILGVFKVRFQKEPSPGNVKAFFQLDEVFWACKRSTSTNILAYEGKYYLKEVCSQFSAVHRSDEEIEWHLSDVLGTSRGRRTLDVTDYNGDWWFISSLTPIYNTVIPFDEVVRYVPRSEAEVRYESVMIGDELRFIAQVRPGTAFFTTGIHEYNQRIEQLLSADKLFKMGTTDLYAKRDKDEVPFLGWELEACSNKSTVGKEKTARVFKDQLPYLVFCKKDGSISPDGFETVSIPATLDAWKETELAAALDVMRAAPYNMRSFEHSSTGFHVHVSRSALSVLDLQKMERFMHNPNNREFLQAVAGRGPTSYQKYDDKLFSDRKYTFSPNTSSPNRTESEGLVWLRPVSYCMSYLMNYSTDVMGFYDWCNMYISFSSSNDAIRNNPQTRTLGAEFRRLTGWYPSFDTLTQVLRHEDNYEEAAPIAKTILIAVAMWGPNINKALRYFFPVWNIAEIGEVTSEAAPAEGISFVANNLVRKTSLRLGRKNSHAAALAAPGPVGKGAQRYDVLNTKNTATIEFRLFKGTLNPASVFRYLEFVDALVRFVPSTSAKDEGVHYHRFLAWLISDSFNVARYENLVSFLTDKSFIERKLIRRKELVALSKGDGDIKQGLLAKKFNPDGGSREPMYRISVREDALPPDEAFNIVFDEASIGPDGSYNGPQEQDPIGEDGCNCPNCMECRRREIVSPSSEGFSSSDWE